MALINCSKAYTYIIYFSNPFSCALIQWTKLVHWILVHCIRAQKTWIREIDARLQHFNAASRYPTMAHFWWHGLNNGETPKIVFALTHFFTISETVKGPIRLFHFAVTKHTASPSAHPPAAAARREPHAELAFQQVISESTVLSGYYFFRLFLFWRRSDLTKNNF